MNKFSFLNCASPHQGLHLNIVSNPALIKHLTFQDHRTITTPAITSR